VVDSRNSKENIKQQTTRQTTKLQQHKTNNKAIAKMQNKTDSMPE
jgi:hypothetical protein